jgi:hypothetical protein
MSNTRLLLAFAAITALTPGTAFSTASGVQPLWSFDTGG